MAKKKKAVKKTDKKTPEKRGFSFVREDFSKENLIEGGLIRPGILLLAFVSFVIATFLLLVGNLKWGGSLIVFSFVLNMYAIYQSMTDEPSIFKTLNLSFKIVLFLGEIVIFNWIGVQTGLYLLF